MIRVLGNSKERRSIQSLPITVMLARVFGRCYLSRCGNLLGSCSFLLFFILCLLFESSIFYFIFLLAYVCVAIFDGYILHYSICLCITVILNKSVL